MDNITESKIKAAVHADIEPILSEYLELDRHGFACCPFHDDKKASFHIYKRSWYKCFGCPDRKAPDGIDFLQRIENCDYPTALAIAAKIYNIVIPDDNANTTIKTEVKPVKVKPKKAKVITYYSDEEVEKTLTCDDTLATFFNERFAEKKVKGIWREMRVGSEAGKTLFWQTDMNGKIRFKKVITYKNDGHRTDSVSFEKKGDYSEQCLFGEHLLTAYPEMPVAVVESEKSALLGTIMYPNFVWVATGGKGELKASKCEVLKNRRVYLFPDVDGVKEWTDKIPELSFCESVEVVDWLAWFPHLQGTKSDIADAWLEKVKVKPKKTENKIQLATFNAKRTQVNKDVERIEAVECVVAVPAKYGENEIAYDDGILRMTNLEMIHYFNNIF